MPERDIDIYQLLSGIGRRWRMIAGFVAIAAISAVLILMLTTPRYTSEVKILFGNTEADAVSPAGQNSSRIDRDLVRSQVYVLQSRDLLLRVIRDLQLAGHSEFDPLKSGLGMKTRLAIWLGFKPDPRLMTSQERAELELGPRISVYPLPDSRVIALDVWAEEPKLAASIANTLAQSYLQESKLAKSRSNKEATQWLSRRINELRNKVRVAEVKVEQFRSGAGLLQGPSSTTLTTQELSEINSQITVASANKAQAEARARQIRSLLKSGNAINASSEILQSGFIQRLREQQITLRRLVADLAAKYLPSHPRMVRLRSEILDLSRQVRGEMRKIVTSLEGQAAIASERVAALRANLNKVKTAASASNGQQVGLNALVRDARASSSLLETYLGRYREAITRSDIETQSASARIISHANTPTTPSYPKSGPILILMSLGALVLGVVIAFLLEIFTINPNSAQQKALGPDQPNRVSGEKLPRHVAFGHAGAVAELPAASKFASQQIETELYTLITEDRNYRYGIESLNDFVVSQASLHGRGTKILTTSHLPDFDKSLATTALARRLAEEGGSVLLIDADFLMQNLSRALELEAFQGLADLILGDAPFTDVVIQDVHSDIHIVPVGSQTNFGSSDDMEMRLEVVIDAFSHAYDYVIVDGGMAYADTPMWTLAKASDVCILFALENSSLNGVTASLYEQVQDLSTGVVGMATIGASDKAKIPRSIRFPRRAA